MSWVMKSFGPSYEKCFANQLGQWPVTLSQGFAANDCCRLFAKVQIVQTPLADPQKYNGGVVQPPFNSSKIVETPPCRLSKVPSKEKLKREATPKNILHNCIKYRPQNNL